MKKRAFALITALCMTLTCFASAETVKHERVYAVTNADGDALTVIDNVRLENGDALTEIDDRTLLTALENVGGTEKFTQSGETVTWKADGNSIIYQGTSDKALNVTPVVRMTLDGKDVTAADVKNASGELVMTVSYRAESPFLAVTVMPLSDDVTSVTVDNGAVLTDGAHSFLMGFGVPGADADLELPDSFTMTAHVDHADLNWMMTIATAQPVKVLTDALSDHAADAHTLVSDLTAGLNALADGSEIPESNEDIHELLTALNTLFDGAAQLKDGSITLLDGVKTLKDGLDTLSSNSNALNDGAAQLFAAVLDTANTQLSAAGLDALSIEVPTLTASNYAAVLDDLIAQLDPAVINKTIEDLAKAQVREAVMAQEDKVREAVTEVVRGQVRDAVQAQEETIRAAVTDVVKEQVRQAVAAQEDTIRAAVTQAVQAQVQDAVQAQEDTIRAGVTQAVQANAVDEDALAELGVQNFDAAIVAIGTDIRASILATVLLKEAGVPKVLAKAVDDLHARVLYKVGADRVIFPERDMGQRVARSLVAPNILDLMALSDDDQIAELTLPTDWADKTIVELNIRRNFGVSVLGIHRGGKFLTSPGAETMLMAGDVLLVMGKKEAISAVQ